MGTGANGPDFHVVSLTYSVKGTGDVTYDAPPPIVFETSEARFHLVEGKLVCRMKVHFAAEVEARTAVEALLRAWELAADLRLGRGKLRFQFESAEVIENSDASRQGEHVCCPERRSYADRYWNCIHSRNAPSISRTSGRFQDNA